MKICWVRIWFFRWSCPCFQSLQIFVAHGALSAHCKTFVLWPENGERCQCFGKNKSHIRLQNAGARVIGAVSFNSYCCRRWQRIHWKAHRAERKGSFFLCVWSRQIFHSLLVCNGSIKDDDWVYGLWKEKEGLFAVSGRGYIDQFCEILGWE